MPNVGLELSHRCSFIHTFTTQRGTQVLNCSYSQTFTSQYCKSIKVSLYKNNTDFLTLISSTVKQLAGLLAIKITKLYKTYD